MPLRASAQDRFANGDGHSGSLSVTTGARAINDDAALAEDASAGASTLRVSRAEVFRAGDLALVWQAMGVEARTALAQTGRWELARVRSVTDDRLTLETPLVQGFSAMGAVVVRVPEYTTVTVAAGASLVPQHPWSGAGGGVVAFVATGAVTLDGSVRADGQGARGGVFVNEVDYNHHGCEELDADAPGFGGAKGEGVVIGRFGPTHNSRGNVANGAGGGDCKNAGGAGGGNGGAGGAGGLSYSDGDRPVGGIGGSALTYSLRDRMTLGGGGGAGHGNDMAALDGGAGGGAIFVRAGSLRGAGVLSASGAASPARNQYGNGIGHDGGSGGGAGGSVVLRVVGGVSGCMIAARGADGSDSAVEVHGPGGGGGGGHVRVEASSAQACGIDVGGGVAGVQQDPNTPSGVHFGAADGSVGVIERAEVPEENSEAPRGFLASGGCSATRAKGGWGLAALLGVACASRRLRARGARGPQRRA